MNINRASNNATMKVATRQQTELLNRAQEFPQTQICNIGTTSGNVTGSSRANTTEHSKSITRPTTKGKLWTFLSSRNVLQLRAIAKDMDIM